MITKSNALNTKRAHDSLQNHKLITTKVQQITKNLQKVGGVIFRIY